MIVSQTAIASPPLEPDSNTNWTFLAPSRIVYGII